MSRMQVSRTQASTRIKRKRAEEVSYNEDPYAGLVTDAEESSDDSGEESDFGDAPSRKKLKANSKKAVAVKGPLPKKKIFPFMKLPGELRNKIYEIALIHHEEIHLVNRIKGMRRVPGLAQDSDFRARRSHPYAYHHVTPAYKPDKPLSRTILRPLILSLNRQIYDEAQPILYGSNKFTFKDSTALLSFCNDIGDTNLKALRHICIKEWGEIGVGKANNYSGFTSLAPAVNLTRLDLDCKIHSSSKDSATQFFREAHRWVEAVYRHTKDRDAVVNLLHIDEANLGKEWPNRSAHPLGVEELEKEIKSFRSTLKEHI